MPGFPIGDLSDAEVAIPSTVQQEVFDNLKRMPLHHIAEANRYNGVSLAFPVNSEDSQVSARFASSDDKSLPNNKAPDQNLVSQFISGIHGSADSENDLAAMVHDFMENGSYGSDIPDSSDGESGLPNCPRLFEILQALKFNATSVEKELLSVLRMFFLSIKDVDLFCLKTSAECKGACIRQMLMKHLKLLGYDAAICSSKWSNSGKVPGGEYDYIDVFFEREKGSAERLIVDVDFQSQFEIARPTQSYVTALKFLPIIFVGSEEKLTQVLQVMAEAAKMSLKQNSMPLPPWRTLNYMVAKWMSPFERSAADAHGNICRGQSSSQWREHISTKQCVQQLRHLKLCMATEIDKNHISKPVNLERNRALCFAKTRRLSTGFAVS